MTITAGGDVSGQIGTFKAGDLTVYANGDIAGYYQVADGIGEITAMGNVLSAHTDYTSGETADNYTTTLALFDAQVTLAALGSVDIGAILNPSLQTVRGEYGDAAGEDMEGYLSYGEDASVRLAAVTGDLFLSGSFVYWQKTMDAEDAEAQRVLPSTVALTAGGDIQIGDDFVLAPSADGNLTVTAGGDIGGLNNADSANPSRGSLTVSELDPDDVYRAAVEVIYAYEYIDGEWVGTEGEQLEDYATVNALFADVTTKSGLSSTPLHRDDATPITLTAGGDIGELMIYTPKQTIITAGGDIRGLYFFGQNINGSDTTLIQAGGDIDLNSVTQPNVSKTGLINGGPGQFVVQAGGDIDLGTTRASRAWATHTTMRSMKPALPWRSWPGCTRKRRRPPSTSAICSHPSVNTETCTPNDWKRATAMVSKRRWRRPANRSNPCGKPACWAAATSK